MAGRKLLIWPQVKITLGTIREFRGFSWQIQMSVWGGWRGEGGRYFLYRWLYTYSTMYSKPSISRLETREVYSWSSAAALPETQHISTKSHSLTNHHEFQNITATTVKFNSLSNHKELKNHFPNYYKLCKSSPPHYYYLLFINSKWSVLRYELKINTNPSWVIFENLKKKEKRRSHKNFL